MHPKSREAEVGIPSCCFGGERAPGWVRLGKIVGLGKVDRDPTQRRSFYSLSWFHTNIIAGKYPFDYGSRPNTSQDLAADSVYLLHSTADLFLVGEAFSSVF